MSGEIIAIISVGAALIGVGVALGTLIVMGNRGVRQDMAQMMAQMEKRLDARLNTAEMDLKSLSQVTSHLGGLVEGLRDAIAGRVRPTT